MRNKGLGFARHSTTVTGLITTSANSNSARQTRGNGARTVSNRNRRQDVAAKAA